MKKTLVTLLALVFVLGIAGTAFAAPANPFVDVPAKHWAYGAVAKLAKAGIVDGYGDGTFRGDRSMTRYEMAQVVAKAMAKSEKADAEMKALIDKLAVEFAAELNNLGVRVAKLEAKTNVGLTYETRIRYSMDDNKNSAKQNTDAFDLRQRIYFAGAVNDKVDFGARIQASQNFGAADGSFVLNRAFFAIKDFAGVDKWTLGRQGVYTGLGLLFAESNGKDGLRLDTKLGDITTLTAFHVVAAKQTEVSAINFTFNPNKETVFNIGYAQTSPTTTGWSESALDAYKATSFDVGIAGKLGDFWLKGEYVATKLKNTLNYDYSKSPKAFSFELSNSVNPIFSATGNMVDPMKAHTDAFAIGYRSIDKNALATTFSAYDAQLGNGPAARDGSAAINGFAQDNNAKGFFFEYQNVLSKGLVFSFDYADLKEKNVGAGLQPQKDKLWMGRLEFYF
jgi:hypothetical protein